MKLIKVNMKRVFYFSTFLYALFLIIPQHVFAQYYGPVSIRNYIYLTTHKNVFLNQKLVNPALLPDTSIITVDVFGHNQKTGYEGVYNSGMVLSGELGLRKYGFSYGYNLDIRNQGTFQHRSFIVSVKNGFEIGSKSRLDFGANVGYWQLRTKPHPANQGMKNWENTTLLTFGVKYKFLNQVLGLSYYKISDVEYYFQSTRYNFGKSRYVFNYTGYFNPTEKLELIPELFHEFGNFDQILHIPSLCSKVCYDKWLCTGWIVNPNIGSGFLLSVIVRKKVKIAYCTDVGYITSNYDNADRTNSHGLSVGLIFD